MSSEIRDTANRIALDFYVWAKHLADQRLQTSKLDDEQLVIGLMVLGGKQKVLVQGTYGLTVDCQISQCSTGRPLYLRIMATEQKEDRVESISPNGTNLFLGNFSESQSGTSLQVHIVGEG